jgi:RNA polymerase sigma-70 factor (ECF subfamily)
MLDVHAASAPWTTTTAINSAVAPDDSARADEDLMARVGANDPDALTQLYQLHERASFALAYRILQDVGQAEDVVQEAFLAVWRQAARFDARRGRLRSWLLTIVHHRAINQLRGRRTVEPMSVLDDGLIDGEQPEVWQQAYTAMRQADLHAALRLLPHDQRRAIELAYLAGLSHSQIARRLDVPLGTVKSRTRLGIRKLQTYLARHAA